MSEPIYPHTEDVQASYSAARQIVPLVIEAMGVPASVIDVGGGLGAWCRAFKEAGSEHVLCVDQPSAGREALLVDADEFLACDLSRETPPARRVDLAVSLECAEHLPADRGEALVELLTRCAPVVLFSAAIPGQPGIGHISCRRPAYWRELFEARGYSLIDVIRPRILYEPSIPSWFKQNLVMYAARDRVAALSLPERHVFIPDGFELVETSNLERDITFRQLMHALPGSLFRAVSFRARKLRDRLVTPREQ